MANPQIENGHIDIANDIAEALMRVNLSPYESRVLWFIFRKTYGWKKKEDWITLSQFSESIGIDRRLAHRAVKGLSSKKMIVIRKDDRNNVCYSFQKDFEKWQVSSNKMTVISRDERVSSVEMTRVSSVEIHTKDNITKDNITKEIYTPACPHQKIIEIYHDTLPGLPRVVKWTDKRKKHLQTCWADKDRQSLSWWKDYFDIVARSNFLLGRSNGFKADLEWLTIESNLVKVLEGRYNNKITEIIEI